MPKKLTLTPVTSRGRAIGGSSRVRSYTTRFKALPRTRSAGNARSALRGWQNAQPAPKAPRNPTVRIRAVRPSRASFTKLRAITTSPSATEVLNQRMDQKTFFGTLYSAIATYEYMQLEAEYRRRKGAGSANADADWASVQKAAQNAFAAGGLKGVTGADLGRFSQTLRGSTANRDAIIAIANTGRVAGGRTRGLTSSLTLTGAFVPAAIKLADLGSISTWIPNICTQPLTQGSFTKHFGSSVSLTVTLTVWCPTWSNPFRTCQKTYTLAGVSWAVDVSVGYKVTCCGATVWGAASVQACATILGVSVCASCTASITGVAGVSRTPVGSNCSYGLGINASLTCTLFGATIFTASAPFGWTITGPCPPAGICP